MTITTGSQDTERSGPAGSGLSGEGCSPAVLAVGRSVGSLPWVLLAELPGTVALADTRALMVASQQLNAELLRRLTDVQRRKLFTLDGAPSIGTWVDGPHIAGVDRSHLALARRLDRVPKSGRSSAPGGSRCVPPSCSPGRCAGPDRSSTRLMG